MAVLDSASTSGIGAAPVSPAEHVKELELLPCTTLPQQPAEDEKPERSASTLSSASSLGARHTVVFVSDTPVDQDDDDDVDDTLSDRLVIDMDGASSDRVSTPATSDCGAPLFDGEVPEHAMKVDDEAEGGEESLLGRERQCAYCRHHGKARLLRGHKSSCPYRLSCKCLLCEKRARAQGIRPAPAATTARSIPVSIPIAPLPSLMPLTLAPLVKRGRGRPRGRGRGRGPARRTAPSSSEQLELEDDVEETSSDRLTGAEESVSPKASHYAGAHSDTAKERASPNAASDKDDKNKTQAAINIRKVSVNLADIMMGVPMAQIRVDNAPRELNIIDQRPTDSTDKVADVAVEAMNLCHDVPKTLTVEEQLKENMRKCLQPLLEYDYNKNVLNLATLVATNDSTKTDDAAGSPLRPGSPSAGSAAVLEDMAVAPCAGEEVVDLVVRRPPSGPGASGPPAPIDLTVSRKEQTVVDSVSSSPVPDGVPVTPPVLDLSTVSAEARPPLWQQPVSACSALSLCVSAAGVVRLPPSWSSKEAVVTTTARPPSTTVTTAVMAGSGPLPAATADPKSTGPQHPVHAGAASASYSNGPASGARLPASSAGTAAVGMAPAAVRASTAPPIPSAPRSSPAPVRPEVASAPPNMTASCSFRPGTGAPCFLASCSVAPCSAAACSVAGPKPSSVSCPVMTSAASQPLRYAQPFAPPRTLDHQDAALTSEPALPELVDLEDELGVPERGPGRSLCEAITPLKKPRLMGPPPPPLVGRPTPTPSPAGPAPWEPYVGVREGIWGDPARHRCEECSLVLDSNCDRIRHRLQQHSLPTQRPCDRCDTVSWSRVQEEVHTAVAHPPELPEAFRCPKCAAAFGSEVLLLTHLKTSKDPAHAPAAAAAAADSFSCPLCWVKVQSPLRLAHHIRAAHTDAAPFACEESKCGAAFDGPVALQSHRNAHVRVNAHNRCLACCLRFVSKELLDAHWQDVHPGPLPFVCPLCTKGCKSPIGLTVHVRRCHPGARPFTCREIGCGRSFSCPVVLHEHACESRHMDLARPQPRLWQPHLQPQQQQREAESDADCNMFRCSACPAVFPDPWSLRDHTDMSHMGLVPIARVAQLLSLSKDAVALRAGTSAAPSPAHIGHPSPASSAPASVPGLVFPFGDVRFFPFPQPRTPAFAFTQPRPPPPAYSQIVPKNPGPQAGSGC